MNLLHVLLIAAPSSAQIEPSDSQPESERDSRHTPTEASLERIRSAIQVERRVGLSGDSRFERGDAALVDVDTDYGVAEIGQTGATHKTDVAGAYHTDSPHRSTATLSRGESAKQHKHGHSPDEINLDGNLVSEGDGQTGKWENRRG